MYPSLPAHFLIAWRGGGTTLSVLRFRLRKCAREERAASNRHALGENKIAAAAARDGGGGVKI